MKHWFSQFRYFDLFMFAASILLLVLGLLMIYSTTLSAPANLMPRQLLFAAVGLAVFFTLAFFDYRNLKKATWWIYLLVVLSLAGVWLFGTTVKGSTRWFDLGFFRIQPSEFAKLAMIVIMAKFLDQTGEKIKSFRYVVLSGIYMAIPTGLILIEDLGSAIVVFAIWIGLLMVSKINKKHLLAVFVIILIASVVGWFFVLQPYQKDRIYTFVNPTADPQGAGYNVLQSIIAVGSGGLWGQGVGRGFQSQLKFLPERQTDFIFASTAEELGLLGSVFILSMFGIVLYRLIRTATRARDNFGMYLSLGIFFMLLTQVLINIGMNLGLLPVTGIPLPLLSYGGSSLLTTLAALGLAQSVVARQKALRFD